MIIASNYIQLASIPKKIIHNNQYHSITHVSAHECKKRKGIFFLTEIFHNSLLKMLIQGHTEMLQRSEK